MKRCPVCKRSCGDTEETCPRCRWDFTQDILTHRSAGAPTKAELADFSVRLSSARGRWRRRGRTALWGNLPAAAARLAGSGMLFYCYLELCSPPLWEMLALGLALFAASLLALQWRRLRSFPPRFLAHELLPLAVGTAAALALGLCGALPRLMLRAGLIALAAAALLVEFVYYETNRLTLRPRLENGKETRAAFPRAQRAETNSWRTAQTVLACLAVGIVLGLTAYSFYRGAAPDALGKLGEAIGETIGRTGGGNNL